MLERGKFQTRPSPNGGCRFLEEHATPAYESWKKTTTPARARATIKRAVYIKVNSAAGPLLQTRRTVPRSLASPRGLAVAAELRLHRLANDHGPA